MSNHKNHLGFFLSATFIFFLLLPSLQYLFHPFTEGSLYGYVENNSVAPEKSISSWVSKELQQWWENNFEKDVGFKNLLVRTFNEINFFLFSESPRVRLYSTNAHGLYSKMSIESLNYEYVNQKSLIKTYSEFAEKALTLQNILEKNGKRLEIVIGSSKAYVHPDGLGERFLARTDSDIFIRAASLGRELERHNVNVIDSGPILRNFYKKEAIETHPHSGVHWNYYAGCIVARDLLMQAKKSLTNSPALDCGDPIYKEPAMVDIDGLLLLNVLSNANITRLTPYPSPTAEFINGYKPSILLVGDSFMDQMVFSLKTAEVYSRLISSSYFRTRDVHMQTPVQHVESDPSSAEEKIKQSIMNDALSSDLIVLQMVDYNVSRLGYGFIDSLVEHIKNEQDHGEVMITSVTGAHDRESDGNIWWHWVERKVDFGLQPSFLSEKALTTRIYLEFSTRGAQTIKLTLIGRNGLQQEISLQGDGLSRQKYDGVINIPPKSLTKLSIESSREPTILGESDQRKTNFLVSNLTVSAD